MNEEMSKDLYERAVKHMPGGVNSPVRAYKAVDRVPRFIASAKGDRITDVDGNEMIDYICSWGPGILGHAHDRVIAKVKEAAEAGLTYGAPTKREVEMAELIYELIPTCLLYTSSKFVCKFIFQLCGFIYATFIFKRFD